MAGPFGKPTGTRPKSRGSEHRDSLGSSASFLSRDLGLELAGPPYFPSREDAGYAPAGALGEHRREMMQQPDGEEQVARNQRQGLPQFPNNQQDNQGTVRAVHQFPNNQDSQVAARGLSQYSNNQVEGYSLSHLSNRSLPVSQYPNNHMDGHASSQSASRGVPSSQYQPNNQGGDTRISLPSSDERSRGLSLEMPND